MQERRQLTIITACVIRNDINSHEPHILLVRRRESAHPDLHLMWELPGGKIEIGEMYTETAIREVKEETGCIVKPNEMVPFPYIVERKYPSYIQDTIVRCYECDFISDTLIPIDDPKIEAVKWVPFTKIDFSEIITGSREFILYIAKQRYNIDYADYKPKNAWVFLACVNSVSNKYYTVILQVEPNASDMYKIVTERGKMYRRGNIIIFHNSNYLDAELKTKKILNDRLKHEYELVRFSDNFPYKSFLNLFPISPLSKQLMLPL